MIQSFGKVILCAVAALSIASSASAAPRHLSGAGSETVVMDQAKADRTIAVQPSESGRTIVTTSRGRDAQQAEPEKKTWKPASRMAHILPMQTADAEGTLIFSDSPEYVAQDGILYQDIVSGPARVFYYHLNSQDTDKKVAVVLEAQEDYTEVRVTRGGIGEPSTDYLHTGKGAQKNYFGNRRFDHLYMMKGSTRLLDPEMDNIVLAPQQLICGTYDFKTNHPVKVMVIMYPADEDPLEFWKSADIQPKDEMRLRGTYAGMDRKMTAAKEYDADKDGIVYVPLADNVHDLYQTGIDATDGSAVTDFGNYGINYDIHIPLKGDRPVDVYLCPLGGIYAGAMTVRLGERGREDLIPTPFGRGYFGDTTPPEPDNIQKARDEGIWILPQTAELAYLGTYQAEDDPYFIFSPPGASNLPVALVLIPALHD